MDQKITKFTTTTNMIWFLFHFHLPFSHLTIFELLREKMHPRMPSQTPPLNTKSKRIQADIVASVVQYAMGEKKHRNNLFAYLENFDFNQLQEMGLKNREKKKTKIQKRNETKIELENYAD